MNRIVFDIPHTTYELLFRQNLALVETPHPHIELALHPKGKSSFDELHSFLKRNIGSRCDESVKMIGHDDECMQKKPSLTAIVEDRLLQQLSLSCDLEEVMALRRYGGDVVGSGFLGSTIRLGSINERPGPEGLFLLPPDSVA